MARRTAIIVVVSCAAASGCNALFGVDDYETDASTGPTTTTTTTTTTSAEPSCDNGIQDGDETDVDCGGSCDACSDLEPLGARCVEDDQCQSGHCPPQDRVCCDTACDATCMACLAAKTGGEDGLCSLVDGSIHVDPDLECSATPPSTCGANGTGCAGDKAACQLWDSSTTCAAPSCFGTTLTSASLCDGAGQCQDSVATSCEPYVCETLSTACRTECGEQVHCATGNYCKVTSSSCEAKKSSGMACSAGYECLSGVCNASNNCQ